MVAVISLNSQTFLGHNQATYQDLRAALQLNLRRQLLIAVCDDSGLQSQLTQRLVDDLSPYSSTGERSATVRPDQSPLVTLSLDSQYPDLVREVLLWLKQQRRLAGNGAMIPAFQIVGVEALTRQSPTIQNRFLASLIQVDALLTQLDCRLLVWVSRPWLGKIQQVVPGFWRSRSGLYEFAGEPTVALPSHDLPHTPLPADVWSMLREDLSSLEQLPSPHPHPPVDLPPAAASPSSDFGTSPQAEDSHQPPLASRNAGAEPVTPEASPRAVVVPLVNLPGSLLLPTDLTAGADLTHPTVDLPESSLGASLAHLLTLGTAKPDQGQADHNPGATDSARIEADSWGTKGDTTAPIPEVPTETSTLDQPSPVIGAESPVAELPVPSPGSPLPAIPAALTQDEPLVNLWHYIQFLQSQQAGPFTLARAHLALGQMSRERLESGLTALPVLNFTLDIYQRATAGLLEGENDWCDALNDLASLYWLRAQQESQALAMEQWLRHSVNAYHRAIEGQTAASPATLGRLYSNLGSVYGLLANGDDPLPALQQAVQAYQQALHYISADTAPLDYANLQNSLGAIHWQLSQLEQPQAHLRQAISAYTEALHHRQAQVAPQEYAMLQNNLGIAYWSLAQHERPTPLLEQAIAAYQSALMYRTVDVTPAGCAATQNNLGTAYWDLAQQQTAQPDHRRTSLCRSLAAYEAALDAVEQALQRTPSESPGFDVWATCHSAGVVHDQLAQASSSDPQQQEKHLQAALSYYLLAYQGWQHNPQQLAVLTDALVYSVRLHFELLGMVGQQAVLAQLPPDLLGQILPKL